MSNGEKMARTWDLGEGAVAAVSLPLRLTKKNISRLRQYVAALEAEASIAWDDDEPAPALVSGTLAAGTSGLPVEDE